MFTPRQGALIGLFKRGGLRRINVLEGSVRSGKTHISLILWALWVATMPREGGFLMCGHTLTTLKRNCLEPLAALIGSDAFAYSLPGKEARLFGRKIFLEGASDARSEGKIRGMTLCGAYCDELTLFPEDFFTMLLSRLSAPGAKLIGTTNPDGPNHWLKVKYLDRAEALSLIRLRFAIEDNTFLPPEYIAQLKREYTGVFYRRYILGLWAVAEGAVYPGFDPDRHVSDAVPALLVRWVGVDYGHANPTVFLMLASGADGRIWVLDEYYHKGADGQKSPRQLSRELSDFEGDAVIDREVIDPSAEGFINQRREDGAPTVRRADNRVLPGIQLLSGLIDADMLRVTTACPRTIAEFQGYVWDDKAQARGEDRPRKQDDHCMDALRYGAMAYEREMQRRMKNA
ncbi:MAG: PBSX family phage terminase large subunit [Clostridia bacterium]